MGAGSHSLEDRRAVESCLWGVPGATTSVVLIGDSNAEHFNETLIGVAGSTGAELAIANRPGCPVSDVIVEASWWDGPGGDVCRAAVQAELTQLEQDPPTVVVVANATDKYVHSDEVVLVDPLTGRTRHVR